MPFPNEPSEPKKLNEPDLRDHRMAHNDLPGSNGTAPVSRPARRIAWGGYVFLVVWTALVATVYGLYSGAVPVQDKHNPWAPLDVSEPPGVLTPYKLGRALNNPTLCLDALERSGMGFDVLPDRVTGPGCGFENAVRLRTAGVRFGALLPLSCPMALSFAMWERHALQPAAQARMQQRVVAIDQIGSYACRNINTGEGRFKSRMASGSGSRSRHATADALDVTGFTLADGQRISVLKNWQSKSDSQDAAAKRDAKALLLTDLHAGACKYFKGVLGPDYNAVHKDHFHFETGGYRMCR